MVANTFIQCAACGKKVNLRIQMGAYNIPFHIHCPICHSTIHGKIDVEGNNTDIKNAHTIDCDDKEFYSVELSAEFPTRKPINKKVNDIELSPFMRNNMLYGSGERAMKETQNAMRFANFIKFGFGDLKQKFELFWNSQDEILFPNLETLISQYSHIPISKVKNNFDAAMALHQILLTTTNITSIIGDDSLREYSEIGKLVIGSKECFNQITGFIDENAFDFNVIEKKGFKLIELFAKVYEQLVPVIALKSGDCFANVDKEKYGIMTVNFDELTDFYAKSYEWILDNIILIVGLNNLFVRYDLEPCVNNKTFQDFIKESKGNRIKNGYIGKTEPFSKPINSLNNRVRNAIQHFDSDIDYETQIIAFKDRNKSVNIYLIDFAALCIDNFCIIFYILELVYNLRKLTFMQEGLIPTILADTPNANQPQRIWKKIGRNEPCPCGSGQKYKRCCGK